MLSAETLLNLYSMTVIVEGKYEDTIKDCMEALELNPNYLKALLRRGEAHEKLEHFEEAIAIQKPREQVADAEALLNITNTLVTSVKAHSKEGITPSDFVNCLLRDFGRQGRASTSAEDGRNSIAWKDVGLAVSLFFMKAPIFCTMLGTMNNELKQRKVVVHKKRVRSTKSSRPKELEDTGTEEKTDTDKNMATMFKILGKNRRVRLESSVLNKNSFAPTVENVFALSFLVKDWRDEIIVNGKGWHIVSPRNTLTANEVVSGKSSGAYCLFSHMTMDIAKLEDASSPWRECW
ncbi:hypothetical protein LOK49_LG07G03286 [Camellia lanceoleosa]|uniref:Uncharacterized protein n=1 Tax=Camellia lanceoleosa TaxID=1840588 RepID=A0ACC0H5L0_9ERIC|nr:hypothetical protein LOK49_LG07G03286 [Camellia lanceoleosa]